ncbi:MULTISPECIES: Gfo/Idh/MocA family protein [unclassified Janthinobacterium]|uniref:Gfo/Idh/MocA family protein n=1 Tax=unclassified Janthinobacterium TaxID=2610881 RepID=UPI001621AD93|nr:MULTISPECIES: Gfo/Idh/MocA family oxidoreductase [unclassified Janthinobacterium]MBB5606407.1 putative dehydrogenase [Janthinobacterium sp. S3T4]MBB5611721.1 putative dehydrogenase [Janthinobacterium sp. S3M3]
MLRLAIIGAGFMARRRARAFVATGRAHIVGIAARRLSSAKTIGAELGCPHCFDDYRRLLDCKPDAVLIEVPHLVQDELVLWALGQGLPTLIGGPLSVSVQGGEKILGAARHAGVLLECGFEARYKAVWETAKELLHAGRIGQPIAVQSIALWNGKSESWYYDQAASGGMPLTHMSYAFINPLRWIFGEPLRVSAFANRIKQTAADYVREETCVANLLFPQQVMCSMLAGYVKSGSGDAWGLTIVGTEGTMELQPTEMENGSLRIACGEKAETFEFSQAQDAFIAQAHAFIDSAWTNAHCRNGPEDCLRDLQVAIAISVSAREGRSIELFQDFRPFS